jgi:hypothetical protein
MPRTRCSASSEPYGPYRSRSVTMRTASAGPMRGRRSSSCAVARSTSIGAVVLFGADRSRSATRCGMNSPRAGRWGEGGAKMLRGSVSTPASVPRAGSRPRPDDASVAPADLRRCRPPGAEPASKGARPFPRPLRSAAPADSTATICRRSASRDAASAVCARVAAPVARTAEPAMATEARKTRAFFSAGVGMGARSHVRVAQPSSHGPSHHRTTQPCSAWRREN